MLTSAMACGFSWTSHCLQFSNGLFTVSPTILIMQSCFVLPAVNASGNCYVLLAIITGSRQGSFDMLWCIRFASTMKPSVGDLGAVLLLKMEEF